MNFKLAISSPLSNPAIAPAAEVLCSNKLAIVLYDYKPAMDSNEDEIMVNEGDKVNIIALGS
jgi:hypothetical protein